MSTASAHRIALDKNRPFGHNDCTKHNAKTNPYLPADTQYPSIPCISRYCIGQFNKDPDMQLFTAMRFPIPATGDPCTSMLFSAKAVVLNTKASGRSEGCRKQICKTGTEKVAEQSGDAIEGFVEIGRCHNEAGGSLGQSGGGWIRVFVVCGRCSIYNSCGECRSGMRGWCQFRRW